MDLNAKDVFLVFAGFVASIIASALFQWWMVRSQKSQETSKAVEELWRARLTHPGFLVRVEATNELLVRSLYWFVLGNVMFAVSGLAWILDLTGIFGFQSIFASVASFGAVGFLSVSMKWLRRYMRLKAPFDPESLVRDGPDASRA